ncbi:septum formation family protein [Nocardiopsis sp. RSe5-2]|uniref:Septum formation family protein n=1 Tax=Nocardiopsis endophytica TaxID=3018445 RepID=A0ABT4TZM8_9ACTN|nr:septum formation family protein [Nocardiopsis endophytica]MDA2809690.1 septum formation family protein [Nocardiopsis endophytica]
MSIRFAPTAKRAVAGLAIAGAAVMASGCGAILSNLQEASQRAEDQGSDSVPSEPTTPAEEPVEESTPPEPTEEDVAAFDIAVGDCLNDESIQGEVSEVPTTDCSGPHDSEVYASTISMESEWPGEQAMTDEADQFCLEEFESFIGVPYEQSAYDFSYYTPTQTAFEQFDRDIYCVVYSPGEQTTGTLSGAAS